MNLEIGGLYRLFYLQIKSFIKITYKVIDFKTEL